MSTPKQVFLGDEYIGKLVGEIATVSKAFASMGDIITEPASSNRWVCGHCGGRITINIAVSPPLDDLIAFGDSAWKVPPPPADPELSFDCGACGPVDAICRWSSFLEFARMQENRVRELNAERRRREFEETRQSIAAFLDPTIVPDLGTEGVDQ